MTIASADYCVSSCQEEWQDEFCTDYPPEGVPNKPREVEDWGTKYNITSTMIREGVRSIHERGGKVNLAYGGTLETDYDGRPIRTGITAMAYVGYGEGDFKQETAIYANELAWRIYKNILDWDLDGVDFFFTGEVQGLWGCSYGLDNMPGYNVEYHMIVISRLREMVGSSKTISYSTIHQPFPYIPGSYTHETAVIAACHPYLDYINMDEGILYSNQALAQLQTFGVPFSKVGVIIGRDHHSEELKEIARLVKELGMSGINLFTINKENEVYRGRYAKMVAEALYADNA